MRYKRTSEKQEALEPHFLTFQSLGFVCFSFGQTLELLLLMVSCIWIVYDIATRHSLAVGPHGFFNYYELLSSILMVFKIHLLVIFLMSHYHDDQNSLKDQSINQFFLFIFIS